tara:strand:+ start:85 stop:255 length:171 start_codon:yes stop_codon:yes gene_type:complete
MKNRTALILLDQILEVSQEKDEQDKVNPEIKLESKVGQSWMTFHLKQLKELLESEK